MSSAAVTDTTATTATTQPTGPTLGHVLSTLGRSVREFKRLSIMTPIIVMGEVVIECILPFITAMLIDAINAGEGMDSITHYSLILIGLALVSLACGAGAGVTCSIASAGFGKNLRHDIFQSVQGFSFGNIDHFSTSSLVTRLTTDVTNVQQAFMMLIRTVVRSPMVMIFSIIMAFVTAGPMASVYVIAAIFLACVLFGIAIHVMPIFRRIFRKYDALNESVEENVRGIRVVKSFVREEYEKEKFGRASGTLFHDFWGAERILAFNQPAMTFAVDVIYASVVYFGSKTIVTSQGAVMGLGSLSALITYGFAVLMSLNMLSMVFVMVTMSAESAERICEVLDEKSDITNPADPVYEVADGSIDFDDVSFVYSAAADRTALSNIDLHIKSGEVIGVIGGTGSSKSTLIQLISRLYDATEGTVRVGGVDVRDYDLKTLRDAVAVVLQRNVLFSGTIKDNLRWGKEDATDEEMVHACTLAQADEFIRQLPQGYDTYIEQGGSNVSGGQKQRLCIARALLKSPKVLILDDSTSAVDTKTDKLIQQGFREFIPSTTKIIIAQRTGSVEGADRIIVMNDGRIDAIGTHEELLRSNKIYRETYLTQNKQSHDDKVIDVEDDADEKGSPTRNVTVKGGE